MRLSDLYFSWWLRPGKVRSLNVGELNRSYVVHVPKGHDLKTPLPVVLALHGATMNGPMMAWFSGLNKKSYDEVLTQAQAWTEPQQQETMP